MLPCVVICDINFLASLSWAASCRLESYFILCADDQLSIVASVHYLSVTHQNTLPCLKIRAILSFFMLFASSYSCYYC